MIYSIGENIVSPLAFTAIENFERVFKGESALQYYEPFDGLEEGCFISKIDRDFLSHRFNALNSNKKNLDITPLEQAAIISATDAITIAGIDPTASNVVFILSTTKGNVHLLDRHFRGKFAPERLCLWNSAKAIAEYFENYNTPIVISNACISGACAQIAAKRELESERYQYAVVIGADMLSPFIISGFGSFKALSSELCRPFDAERKGLNLGEAAATIIYCSENAPEAKSSSMVLEEGAIRNDANHISGPSRTGEGSFLALQEITKGIDLSSIAFVNAHGTSTLYNDEMESIALLRMALNNTPVNSLKGYFGHTLGAAGVVETIISSIALKRETALRTNGFETLGVTNPLVVTTENIKVSGERFIKMLSGFGGCNAALLLRRR